jgi:hypothetical protein
LLRKWTGFAGYDDMQVGVPRINAGFLNESLK